MTEYFYNLLTDQNTFVGTVIAVGVFVAFSYPMRMLWRAMRDLP